MILVGKLLDKLQNKTVSLPLDGWSNVHNEPAVCDSVATDKGDIFLTDIIDTIFCELIQTQASDYLTQLAENSIMSCQEKF